MINPDRSNLLTLSMHDGATVFYSCSAMHPNARPWKYQWQVFTLDSPWEKHEFFANATQLCTADFHELLAEYVSEGKCCIVFNRRHPRLDPSAPWDTTRLRWQGVKFACSWAKDSDPIFKGHK